MSRYFERLAERTGLTATAPTIAPAAPTQDIVEQDITRFAEAPVSEAAREGGRAESAPPVQTPMARLTETVPEATPGPAVGPGATTAAHAPARCAARSTIGWEQGPPDSDRGVLRTPEPSPRVPAVPKSTNDTLDLPLPLQRRQPDRADSSLPEAPEEESSRLRLKAQGPTPEDAPPLPPVHAVRTRQRSSPARTTRLNDPPPPPKLPVMSGDTPLSSPGAAAKRAVAGLPAPLLPRAGTAAQSAIPPPVEVHIGAIALEIHSTPPRAKDPAPPSQTASGARPEIASVALRRHYLRW